MRGATFYVIHFFVHKEPQEIILYDVDSGEPDGSYQYVPLLLTLESLLNHDGIFSQILKLEERIRDDGLIEDYCM